MTREAATSGESPARQHRADIRAAAIDVLVTSSAGSLTDSAVLLCLDVFVAPGAASPSGNVAF